MDLLEIRDLHAGVGDVPILKGIDLTIRAGEVHAIMGPNGSGKSTLARVLAGHESYVSTRGDILYKGQSLLEMPPEDRAREGVFMAFQYPYEIPGVSTQEFLKTAYNSLRQHRGQPELDAVEFYRFLKDRLKVVEMDSAYLSRSLNDGFSGGEKKRNEILQMAVLEPELAVLDETDSGLDIDALRIVSEGINRLRSPSKAILLITHYQRMLDYVEPDYVHVLMDGRIVESGDGSLALHLEEHGYDWVREGAITA